MSSSCDIYLGDIGMDVELIEEYFCSPQSSGDLYPLHQLHTDILQREVKSLAANCELFLPLTPLERLVDNPETVAGGLTSPLHQRDDSRDPVLVTVWQEAGQEVGLL